MPFYRQEDLPNEMRDVELRCLQLLTALRTERDRLVMTHKGAPLKDVTLIKDGDIVICALVRVIRCQVYAL